ncbi:NUDIX domain-containing protein [Legionella sp. 27cVA30]|uniref:NUDIX domain-containing protein n=1 Tax=Legionella sp. 27cVA30 TaxID=2905657 RepID=UPI00209DDE91|nr:NUDIX domain-containing protein [Legionella sp. 27cVA30]MCP0914642.1 NUDIX domain-containing protein [Legionella sp. 27cVA30]
MGARALIIDNDKVLLVRHTYAAGWYTVGGGIQAGETPTQAIIRELKEEVGIILTHKPQLFSVYHKRHHWDDYIILFICKHFIQEAVNSPEIAEQKWFPLKKLPPDVSPATKRRILEYQNQLELTEEW